MEPSCQNALGVSKALFSVFCCWNEKVKCSLNTHGFLSKSQAQQSFLHASPRPPTNATLKPTACSSTRTDEQYVLEQVYKLLYNGQLLHVVSPWNPNLQIISPLVPEGTCAARRPGCGRPQPYTAWRAARPSQACSLCAMCQGWYVNPLPMKTIRGVLANSGLVRVGVQCSAEWLFWCCILGRAASNSPAVAK